MEADPSPEQASSRMGDRALALGIAALVCAFIPVIGDFIAVPAAVLAIVLGFAEMRRDERGRASRAVPAFIGSLLGEIALLVVLMALAATHLLP